MAKRPNPPRDTTQFARESRKKLMPGDGISDFQRTMTDRLMPGGSFDGMAEDMRRLVAGAKPFTDATTGAPVQRKVVAAPPTAKTKRQRVQTTEVGTSIDADRMASEIRGSLTGRGQSIPIQGGAKTKRQRGADASASPQPMGLVGARPAGIDHQALADEMRSLLATTSDLTTLAALSPEEDEAAALQEAMQQEAEQRQALQEEDVEREKRRRGVTKVFEQIEAANKKFEHWYNRCKRIRDRYIDKRDDANMNNHRPRRYSMLWSNIQILFPALFSRMPEPNVTRRWKTQDPVGLLASTIIERGISWNIDVTRAEVSTGLMVMDNLLYARGVLWARYEPAFRKVKGFQPVIPTPDGGMATPDGEPVDDDAEITTDEAGNPVMETVEEALEDEKVWWDYVHHQDFLHEPARSWDEVTWVARRVYMTKPDAEERFGEDVAGKLTYTRAGTDGSLNDTQTDATTSVMVSTKNTAAVWEVWNRSRDTVCWVSKGFDDYLDEGPPPYRLDGFFPCPHPFYGTTTTDSLEPIPDYSLYQDQAQMLDEIEIRIGKLQEALRLVGFYDGADSIDLTELLKAGNENKLIGIGGFGEFVENGGFNNKIQWMPIGEVQSAMASCQELKQSIIADIYQITGISDIVRGSTDPNETLGAQELKAQFGSLRIQARQKELARFLRDMMRITAEIMAEVFQPITLSTITEKEIDDAMADFLRNDFLRSAKLDIESDATAALDEQAEKESRTEFVQAMTGFVSSWGPIIQQAPGLAPLASDLLLFAVRAYKGARDLEPTIEATFQGLQQQAEQQQAMQQEQAMLEQQAAAGAPGPLPVDAPPGGGGMGASPMPPPALPPPPGMPMQ